MKVSTHRSLLAACILGSAIAAPQAMADGRLCRLLQRNKRHVRS